MTTVTADKPKAAGKPKPAAAKPKRTPPSTAGRTVNKRTVTEYREALIEKKAKILQAAAVRVGKIDKRIAAIDEKHAGRVAAAEAIKAAAAEGKSAADLKAELKAQIKTLQAQGRFLNKV